MGDLDKGDVLLGVKDGARVVGGRPVVIGVPGLSKPGLGVIRTCLVGVRGDGERELMQVRCDLSSAWTHHPDISSSEASVSDSQSNELCMLMMRRCENVMHG